MHIKNFIFSLACVSALCSLGFSIRDDMAARNTDYSTGIPNVAFVEYLESDGNQFIDIYPQSGNECNVKVECAFFVVGSSSSGQQFVFSPSSSLNDSGPRLLVFRSNMWVSCDSWNAVNIVPFAKKMKYEVSIVFSSDNTMDWVVNQYSGIANRNFYIKGNRDFRLFQANVSQYNLYGRIYYFRLYIDGILVRDLRPLRIGSVGYMYDTLTGDLLGNGGTGDFIIGPDTQEF